MFGKPQMISDTDDPHRRRQSSNAADVFRRSFSFAISLECFHGCLLGYWSSGSIAPGRFLARGLVRRPETDVYPFSEQLLSPKEQVLLLPIYRSHEAH